MGVAMNTPKQKAASPWRGEAAHNKILNPETALHEAGTRVAIRPGLISQIKVELSKGIEHAVRAGQLLAEAKSAIPHGHWLSWLDENFSMSKRTAQNLMRLAARLPNAQETALLTATAAIALITEAKPKPETTPSCLFPASPTLALAQLSRNVRLMVQESAEHHGYYFVGCVADDADGTSFVDVTGKPVRQDSIEQTVALMLPDDLKGTVLTELEWDFNEDADPGFVQKIRMPWSGDIEQFEATKARTRVEIQRARAMLDDPQCDIGQLQSIIDIINRWERTLSLFRMRSERREAELAFNLVQASSMTVEALRAAVNDGSFIAACEARIYDLAPCVPLTESDYRHSVRRMLEDAEWSQWSDDRIAVHVGVPLWVVFEGRRELGQNLVAPVSDPSTESVMGCSADAYRKASGADGDEGEDYVED